jgi:uncharacterized protein DUF6496
VKKRALFNVAQQILEKRTNSGDSPADTGTEVDEENGLKEVKMTRYGKESQASVKRAMEEMKEGRLKSGASGKKVRNPKQAIAIGLSEARRKGAKVPPLPSDKRMGRSTSKARSKKG